MMRILAFTVLASAATSSIAVDEAHACGTWSLEDHEKDGRVVFHASTVSLVPRDPKQAKRDIIRIDDAGTAESVHGVPHGWTKHAPPPPEHTFEGDTLLHHGKPIGALTEKGFTIHGVDYVITTERLSTEVRPASHEPAFLVTVTRGDTKILSGVGRTICPGDSSPREEVQRAIMLRRIAIYLAASRP